MEVLEENKLISPKIQWCHSCLAFVMLQFLKIDESECMCSLSSALSFLFQQNLMASICKYLCEIGHREMLRTQIMNLSGNIV